MTESFELRLLEELKLLVETPTPVAAPASRRFLPRSRFVLALVIVALVVGATAASVGAWRLLAEDPHKASIVTTLQQGGHVGPLVASDGSWSLYVQPGTPTDWELDSAEDTAAGGFPGKRPIDLTSESGASGYEVLAGQVNVPGAASVAVVLPGGRTMPVRLEGKLFLVALSSSERHPEEILALDGAGKVVARARP